MEDKLALFILIVDGARLTTIVGLVMVNFILGIAVSVKTGNFKLKEFGDFLRSRALPFLLGYYAIGMLAVIDEGWWPFVTVVFGIIVATLAGAIAQSLKELGLPLPDRLGGGSK